MLTFRVSFSFAACAFALAFGAGCGGGSSVTSGPQGTLPGEAFRSVAAVSTFDGRYNLIDSQVINSPSDVDRVIAATDTSESGLTPISQSSPLFTALRAPGVDFDKEALVVLKGISGGGGYQLVLNRPELQGRTFVSALRTVATGQGGGTAISFHFYVFAVSRDRVDDVRVAVVPASGTNGTPETIRLTVPDRPQP